MTMHSSTLLRHIEARLRSAFPLLAPRCLLLIVIALACFALLPHARAQCRDSCDDLGNIFQGTGTLLSNTSYQNSALGYFALAYNTSGHDNTATGNEAAFSNTTGSENMACGSAALSNNTTGSQNTAVGRSALFGDIDAFNNPNSTASFNTAVGFESLYSVTTGGGNVADGWQALHSNTSGRYNTASGVSALRVNTTGNQNTATGVNALYFTNGANNTADGAFALEHNTSGAGNVALGYQAGNSLTTGSNNIVIGAGLLGKAGEANTTRIGKTTQTATYIGGIYGKTVASASGVAVRIDSTGKLGTVLSSERYKDNIKPMDESSEAILGLKPVSFNYKKELDPDGVRQFGLIAEQVEKVDPDLVVRDEDGKVSTVRYEAVNAMLLNEFLKEHRRAEEQRIYFEGKVAQQQKQIEALTATVQKVSDRADNSHAAPRILVANP